MGNECYLEKIKQCKGIGYIQVGILICYRKVAECTSDDVWAEAWRE